MKRSVHLLIRLGLPQLFTFYVCRVWIAWEAICCSFMPSTAKQATSSRCWRNAQAEAISQDCLTSPTEIGWACHWYHAFDCNFCCCFEGCGLMTLVTPNTADWCLRSSMAFENRGVYCEIVCVPGCRVLRKWVTCAPGASLKLVWLSWGIWWWVCRLERWSFFSSVSIW